MYNALPGCVSCELTLPRNSRTGDNPVSIVGLLPVPKLNRCEVSPVAAEKFVVCITPAYHAW